MWVMAKRIMHLDRKSLWGSISVYSDGTIKLYKEDNDERQFYINEWWSLKIV